MEALRYQRSVLETSRDEGYTEGRADGISEGKNEERITIARNLLSLDIPTPQIMQATGLTEDEINKLA